MARRRAVARIRKRYCPECRRRWEELTRLPLIINGVCVGSRLLPLANCACGWRLQTSEWRPGYLFVFDSWQPPELIAGEPEYL